MSILTKAKMGPAFLGTAAAAVMIVSAASPAMAQGRQAERGHRDNISAGEVIAGVAILGGIAAILASDKNGSREYDRNYDRNYDRDGGRNYNNNHGANYSGGYRNPARQATNMCIRSIEGGRYNQKQVTDIRDIERTRYGYRVKGRLAVSDGYQGGRGRGHGDQGYNRYGNDYDNGKFTCYVERGRVVDIDFSGIRGY